MKTVGIAVSETHDDLLVALVLLTRDEFDPKSMQELSDDEQEAFEEAFELLKETV